MDSFAKLVKGNINIRLLKLMCGNANITDSFVNFVNDIVNLKKMKIFNY